MCVNMIDGNYYYMILLYLMATLLPSMTTCRSLGAWGLSSGSLVLFDCDSSLSDSQCNLWPHCAPSLISSCTTLTHYKHFINCSRYYIERAQLLCSISAVSLHAARWVNYIITQRKLRYNKSWLNTISVTPLIDFWAGPKVINLLNVTTPKLKILFFFATQKIFFIYTRIGYFTCLWTKVVSLTSLLVGDHQLARCPSILPVDNCLH